MIRLNLGYLVAFAAAMLIGLPTAANANNPQHHHKGFGKGLAQAGGDNKGEKKAGPGGAVGKKDKGHAKKGNGKGFGGGLGDAGRAHGKGGNAKGNDDQVGGKPKGNNNKNNKGLVKKLEQEVKQLEAMEGRKHHHHHHRHHHHKGFNNGLNLAAELAEIEQLLKQIEAGCKVGNGKRSKGGKGAPKANNPVNGGNQGGNNPIAIMGKGKGANFAKGNFGNLRGNGPGAKPGKKK